MAIVPLFLASMASLKQHIRLSGVPAGSDADVMLAQAVLDARLGFFDKITATRCQQIAAITHSDTPLTADEQTRSLAESTEIKWVRLICMQTHPTFFLEGNSVNQVWNQEAPFRAASQSDLKTLMSKLETEINAALEKLAGAVTQETSISAADIGPKHSQRVGIDLSRAIGRGRLGCDPWPR